MEKQKEEIQGTEKEFLTVFNQLCYSRQSWQVWADLISAMACSIANISEVNPKRRADREKEYERCLKELGGDAGVIAKLFAIVVMALENNPEQDFLGALYMQLNLGSHWHGQFFTPASVAKMMSQVSVEDTIKSRTESEDYISVIDPSCGAGVTLISAAAIFRERGINYQQEVLFTGQDIDRVAGQMCYIQLSLLGCAGYICIADTLGNPVTGPPLQPQEKTGQEFWYTPFYYSDIWQTRIFAQNMRRRMRGGGIVTTQKTVKKGGKGEKGC